MSEIYEKMYAHLVGEVDDSLQMIADSAGQRDGEALLRDVASKLKKALLAAEEMYVDAEGAFTGDLDLVKGMLGGSVEPERAEEVERQVRELGVVSEKEAETMLKLAFLMSGKLDQALLDEEEEEGG